MLQSISWRGQRRTGTYWSSHSERNRTGTAPGQFSLGGGGEGVPCFWLGPEPSEHVNLCSIWERQFEVPSGTWLLPWPPPAWQPPSRHSEPSHGCQLRRKRELVSWGPGVLSPQLCLLVPVPALGSHSSICKMEAEPRV